MEREFARRLSPTAICPLAGRELAKSTAYQEHRKPLAKSRSRKPWKSGILPTKPFKQGFGRHDVLAVCDDLRHWRRSDQKWQAAMKHRSQ
jgi:hypothetical protein